MITVPDSLPAVLPDESYAKASGTYRAQECGPGTWGVAVLEWRIILSGMTEAAARQLSESLNGTD